MFDPLGFAAPVSIQGRTILRELTTDACEWDEPLPKEKLAEWLRWKNSLQDLQGLKIPRLYTSLPFYGTQKKEMCVFCDASIKAIGAVAYLKVINAEGQSEVGFKSSSSLIARWFLATYQMNQDDSTSMSTTEYHESDGPHKLANGTTFLLI